MSVNNKDILQVWWGLTDFYPSALIYHVFIKTMCWWKSRTQTGCGYELGHGVEYLFVVLTRFSKFCIALALYCYFMFIDPCCIIGFWP